MATETLQHRPPKDMLCPSLQVTDGCTWGKCKFCDIYNEVGFIALDMEEIKADIEQLAKTTMKNTHRIYLTGGNPFALSTQRLMDIFDAVEARMPQINSYGGFCRIMDVAEKSDEELAALASRGVNDICIGAETGYDSALSTMNKGCTAADILTQSERLKKAGIEFTFFYLAGLAGAGQGTQNALASAEVFSKANPKTILIVTLTPTKTWRLAQDVAAGTWEPAGEVETIEEIRTFIANLLPGCSSYINCSHDSDVIRFEGIMPKDQENMVALLDARIPKVNENAARRMRCYIHGATFDGQDIRASRS